MNFKKFMGAGDGIIDQAKGVKVLFDTLIAGMNQLNSNMIIVQENQVEIGKRLERIERQLNLPEFTITQIDDPKVSDGK